MRLQRRRDKSAAMKAGGLGRRHSRGGYRWIRDAVDIRSAERDKCLSRAPARARRPPARPRAPPPAALQRARPARAARLAAGAPARRRATTRVRGLSAALAARLRAFVL